MTNKEFDTMLSEALGSDEVPPALNRALLEKVRQKKTVKAKIYTFTKTCSAIAAVFICVIAVLSYFNSDTSTPREDVLPREKEGVSVSSPAAHTKKEKDVSRKTAAADKTADQSADSEDKNPVSRPSEKASGTEKSSVKNDIKRYASSQSQTTASSSFRVEEKPTANTGASSSSDKAAVTQQTQESEPSTAASSAQESDAGRTSAVQEQEVLPQPVPQKSVADPEISADTAASDEAKTESQRTEDTGSSIRTEAYTLPHTNNASSLFTAEPRTVTISLKAWFADGYDYIGVISSRISEQIRSLPNASEYTFTAITGNENYSTASDGTLTIRFAPGTIIKEEHGEQFFTVGTIKDGKLE